MAQPKWNASVLKPEQAREFLVGHHGLRRNIHPKGIEGARQLLRSLRCIQLDPLNVLGTNADVVAAARIDGLKKGEIYSALLPGHAFEHFAKERCLLPAHYFPWYRAQAAETPWWRLSERKRRIPRKIVDAVLAEVQERGPATAKSLTSHGKVKPLDWNGWKGTSSATSMALEILWTQCRVVVCGRKGGTKIYDVPERALPEHHNTPAEGFARWALLERVEMAGLLSLGSGPHWSMISHVRNSPLVNTLIEERLLQIVQLKGSPRYYLAPYEFLHRKFPRYDDRMRLLAPLDSLLWDRELVQRSFGFEYIWEVYKPFHQRRWGWYVYPLLHRGQLVGRLEGKIEKEQLKIQNIWKERGVKFDRGALEELLSRHCTVCHATGFTLPKSIR